MSAETQIRAALAAIKKADGQRELIQAQFELARVCSDNNITALLTRIDALQRDAERFKWYFGDCPKGDWMCTYLDGMKTGWTTDEWRSAIDAAMAQSEGGA